GLVANTLLAAVMGLVDSLAVFLVVRFLAGVVTAIVMVFLARIVFGHLAAAGRTDLQALHFGGVGVGIAASSATIALMIVEGAGWQAGWFAAAGLTVIGLVVVAATIRAG